MIAEMVHFRILGLKSDIKELIEHIRDLGVFHITEEDNGPPSVATKGPVIEKMRFLRASLLGLLEDLGWKDWDNLDWDSVGYLREVVPLDDIGPLDEIEKSLVEFKERLNEIKDEIKSLEESVVALKQVYRLTSYFQPFFVTEKNKGYKVSLWLVNSSKLPNLLKTLETNIRNIIPAGQRPFMGYKTLPQGKDLTLLALSVVAEINPTVSKIIEDLGGVPYRALKSDLSDLILESPNMTQMELKWLPKKLAQAKKTFEDTRREWGPRLAALYTLMDERLESLALERKLIREGEYFTLNAWVPRSNLEEVISSLKERFKDRILITWRSPKPEEWDEVPVLLENPKWARPFEVFLKLLPLPGYKSMDPTPLIAIFFPLFAGCMIGDVGYGIIFLLCGIWLKARNRERNGLLCDILQILINISIFSILWGFLYGEFFGDLGHRLLHLKPLWVERTRGVVPVMAFAVALGFTHVMLGLMLGAYEGIKCNNKRHVCERIGTISIILGAVIFVADQAKITHIDLLWPAIALLVFGLTLLARGGGLTGLVETIGSIGNILSYIRIAAIGLSSAILAMVATKFLDVFGASFFGIMLALLIHLLNLIIAIVGSALHSARLHYVEFFGKFYEGKGNKYKPFSRRRETAWKRPY